MLWCFGCNFLYFNWILNGNPKKFYRFIILLRLQENAMVLMKTRSTDGHINPREVYGLVNDKQMHHCMNEIILFLYLSCTNHLFIEMIRFS